MLWSLIMDGVVAVLLIATIGYVVRLNNRLGVLRQERERLKELIAGLQTATRQAEDAVRALKQAAAESGQGLQATIDRSGSLRADLSFLVETAGATADRLEATLRAQRDAGPAPMPRASREAAPTRPVAVEQPVQRRPQRETAAEPSDADSKAQQSRLASLLRQAQAAPPARSEPTIDRNPPRPPAEPPRGAPTPSRAERDLMRALQGRR